MHFNKFRVLAKFQKSICGCNERIPKSRNYYVQLSPVAQKQMGQGFHQRYKVRNYNTYLIQTTFHQRWIHGSSKDQGDGIPKELSEIKLYLNKTKCSEKKYEFLLALREHNIELYYRYFCQNPSQVVSILRNARDLDYKAIPVNDRYQDFCAIESKMPQPTALELSKLCGQQHIATESSMDKVSINPENLDDGKLNDQGDGIPKELSEIKIYLNKTKCSKRKYGYLLALREQNIELYYRYFCENPSQMISILTNAKGFDHEAMPVDDKYKELCATEKETPHTSSFESSKLNVLGEHIAPESSVDIVSINPENLDDGKLNDQGDGIPKELSEIKKYLNKTKCSERKYEFLINLREHNIDLYYRYFCENPSQVVSILRNTTGLDYKPMPVNNQIKSLCAIKAETPYTSGLELSKLGVQQHIPSQSSMDIVGINPQTLVDVKINNSILGKLDTLPENRKARMLHKQECKEVYKYGRRNRNLYVSSIINLNFYFPLRFQKKSIRTLDNRLHTPLAPVVHH